MLSLLANTMKIALASILFPTNIFHLVLYTWQSDSQPYTRRPQHRAGARTGEQQSARAKKGGHSKNDTHVFGGDIQVKPNAITSASVIKTWDGVGVSRERKGWKEHTAMLILAGDYSHVKTHKGDV
jgi:hypothetical protein